MPAPTRRQRIRALWRALIEMAFIIFLFYANLLMGEFIRSNQHGKTLAFALRDIFTVETIAIALVSALVGYLGFEHIRGKI